MVRGAWPMGQDEGVDLLVDFGARVVHRNGQMVALTRTEFAVLVALFENRGAVLSHARLAELLWGSSSAGDESRLAAHVRNLRGKLGDSGSRQRWIRTVHGVGYAWGLVPEVRGGVPSTVPHVKRVDLPVGAPAQVRERAGSVTGGPPAPEGAHGSAWVEFSARIGAQGVRVSGVPELVEFVKSWWSKTHEAVEGLQAGAQESVATGRRVEDRVFSWLLTLVPPGWLVLAKSVTTDAGGLPQQVSVRVAPKRL